MLHFFHFVKRQVCKSWLMKACKTFSSLEREGDRRTSVESRIHYVNQKEWRQYVTLLPQNYEIFDFHTIDSPVFSGGWWKVECCMLEHRKACWCAPFEVDCLAYLSQALMRTRSPLIENSYKFPIVRNCGQWREDILVIPCATSITQKLPLEVFAVPPFDVKGPSRVP